MGNAWMCPSVCVLSQFRACRSASSRPVLLFVCQCAPVQRRCSATRRAWG
jgi:hypothetical protein